MFSGTGFNFVVVIDVVDDTNIPDDDDFDTIDGSSISNED